MNSSGTKWMESGHRAANTKGAATLVVLGDGIWWQKIFRVCECTLRLGSRKNHWNNYTLKSTNPTEGIWCNYVGEADPGTEQHYCFNGWPVYSKK